jgi:O-antigen ligase
VLSAYSTPFVGGSLTHRRENSSAPALPVETGTLSLLGKTAFASLCLLVFSIPWEDAVTIAGFGTIVRLIGAVAVGLGAMAMLERGKLRRSILGHLLMVLFVMVAALSYMWSLYPEGTLTQTYTYIQLLIMVWLIWELSVGLPQQKRLMQAYILGTCISALDTIYEFFFHEQSVYERYAGAKMDANDLGLMMALSIPFSYYLLIQSRGKIVWLYRLHLVLAGTTVVLTASRGAALSTVVALAIVPLTQSRLTGRQRTAVLLSLALLVSGVLFFAPETSWERLSTVPSEFEHGTMTGRTLIWSAGWQIFRRHPVLGIGANAFRVVVSRVLEEPIRMGAASPAPPAHNTFLSVLVEQGAIGFALFCALLGWLALSVRAMPALPRQLWSVSLTVWAVGVSSLTWEMRKPTWFLFGLLMVQIAAWCGSSETKCSVTRLMDVNDLRPQAQKATSALTN